VEKPAAMIDIHPPQHAPMTRRDFFVHLGIVVLGILIAIGLEQTVEYFHHRDELQNAREELREDIAANRRSTAEQLQCIHQIQAELNADMALLIAHRASNQPLTGKLQFDWNFRRSRSVAYNLNKQSGALNLMPHPELAHYDYAFTVTDAVMDAAAKWQVELETARAIASRAPDGTLSPQDTNELITAISDTQGNLARTERLITFVQGALGDSQFDH
jgi:hypothetical protein